MYTDIRPVCAELDRFFDGGDPTRAYFAAGQRLLEIEGEAKLSRGDISRLLTYILTVYQQELKKPITYQIRDDTRLDPVVDWFTCLPTHDVEARAIEMCELAGVDYWDDNIYVAPANTPDKPLEKSYPAPDPRVGREYDDAPPFFLGTYRETE